MTNKLAASSDAPHPEFAFLIHLPFVVVFLHQERHVIMPNLHPPPPYTPAGLCGHRKDLVALFETFLGIDLDAFGGKGGE